MNLRSNPVSEARKKFVAEKSQGKLNLQEIENKLIPLDPSPTGEYLSWVANMVLQERLRLPEDAETFKNALTKYHQLKQQNTLVSLDRNIFNYKQPSDLYQRLAKYAESQIEAPDISPLEKMTQIGEFEIFQINDPKTLQKLSRDTHWCTSNEDLAKTYSQYAKIFLITQKKKKYALMHFPNYSAIYREYQKVLEKIEQLLRAGINPFDGQNLSERLKGEYRPEIKNFFSAPTLELVAGKSIWEIPIFHLLSAKEYFKEIAERQVLPINRLEVPEFQLRNIYDNTLPTKVQQQLLPWALKVYQPTPADSPYYYLDYFKAFTATVLRDQGPMKIVLEQLLKVSNFLKQKHPSILIDCWNYLWEYDARTSFEKRILPQFRKAFQKQEKFRLAPSIFRDPIIAQRYYQIAQSFLKPAEKEQFQTKLKRLHHPVEFQWPSEHYLAYYYRIEAEENLVDKEQELKDLETAFEKEGPQEAKYVTELQLPKLSLSDLTVSGIQEVEGIKKQIIPNLKQKMQVLQQAWERFKILTEELIAKRLTMPLDQFLLKVIRAYRKSGLKKLDFPLRRDSENRGFWAYRHSIFGPERQTLWKLPYLIFDSAPTLQVVIERLVDAYAPLGMVEHLGKYYTSQGFLKKILLPVKRGRPEVFAYHRKQGWTAPQIVKKQQELIESIEQEFKNRPNPLIARTGTIADEAYYLYRKIYQWMRSYGLGTRGFTIIGPDVLRKKLARQVGSKKMQQLLPPGLLGGLLITCRSYDNLCDLIRMKKKDSAGFRKLRRKWYSQDPLADQKMMEVKKKLREHLNEILDELRFQLLPELPLVLKPKDPHHYKAKNYFVYPIYLNT